MGVTYPPDDLVLFLIPISHLLCAPLLMCTPSLENLGHDPAYLNKFIISECKWNKECVRYPVTFCNQRKQSDESMCKESIDRGEPCCMAGKDKNYGYLCLNTSYDGEKISKFSPCYHLVQECQWSKYIPSSKNTPCKAFSGNVLDNRDLHSELQCADICMRDLRCVAYNVKKEMEGHTYCQLLGSISEQENANCKLSGFTGKLLDRTAFFKAYMNANYGCR